MTRTILQRFPMDRWPAMRAFLAARFRPDLALCDRSFFEWFFRATDAGAEIVTAWDGDTLIGTLGTIADPAFWGQPGVAVTAAWLVNWTVDPAYQHGTGIALLRDVQTRFDVLLGIGASAENERIAARLRWTIVPSIARFVAIFDADRTAELALPGAAGAARAAAAAPLRANAPLREWQPADPEPDWSRYSALAFATIPSARYLTWRYLEHPTYDFRLFVTGEALAPAIAAIRIERAQGSGTPVGRVIEFFHPDGEAGVVAGIDLARGLADIFREEGCAFADFVCSAERFGTTFAAAGWQREDDVRPLLPVRLQPVERSAFRFNLEYGVRRGFTQPGASGMYATRGNGDADRPTSIPAAAAPIDDK